MTAFIYPLFWLRTLLNLKFFVNPKSAWFWDWLWFLINIPHDRYSKTHSVGLDSWCSCMDVHIIWPGFWYMYNYNHLYWTYITNINDFPNTMFFMSYLYKPVSEWMHPFNLWKSICSNELCLIVLYRYTDEWQLSGVIHWRIPSPKFPSDSIYDIAHTILQQFFVSIFRGLPPVSLEIFPLAYIEVCLLYQSVFREYNLETWNHEDVIKDNAW